MGKKDTLTKDYMKNTQVFADAFNHLIYQGKKKINPEMLHTVDTTELSVLYGNDEKRKISYPIQKYRDELKILHTMEDGQAVYVLLGVENQSEVHYAMPVKDMVYDALEYASQVDETARKHRREGRKGTAGEYLSGFHEMETKTVMMLNELTNANLNVDERKEKQNMRTAIVEIREEAEMLGEARGERKGEIKGEIKGQKNLIDRALRNGKSEQEIAAFFDMPLEEMQKLQETNKIE